MDIFTPEVEITLTQQGTVRKRKPKQANIYFTQETEDAIVRYTKSEDQEERNEIFNTHINYAFHKLAENIIHTFKFYYSEVETIEELKHEVVCVLLEKLKLYKQEKGKAYSYFGTIVKRYLIVYNNNNYKKLKNKATLDEVDTDQTIVGGLVDEVDYELGKVNFIDVYIDYIDDKLFTLFPKDNVYTILITIKEHKHTHTRTHTHTHTHIYIY